jgi:DNA-binding SARP family transcriptional activator
MALQIAILGSVEPRVNGNVVSVPAGKQRALLTRLAVHAPHPVSAESAAEALWPRAAPAEAMRNLQVTVSRLRRSLGAAGSVLETVASGYRLAVEADAIDARRFETLVDEARAARVAGDGEAARRLLDDALGLWRGPALADVGFESFAQAEIARLEEFRLVALEERIDVRLSAGEHALVVAELEQLSAEHPSRERLVGLLMLALYRCGRQSDALEVYTRGRLRLDEELGLEPLPELQRLQEAILRQDTSLELEPSDLPHELRAGVAPAIVGRDRELEWLRAHWERARAGAGELVVVMGAVGMGKTRLAVELAAEVHRAGAAVLYASGWEHPEAVVAVARGAREATRPTLLVVDDADGSGAALAAVAELARQLAGTPVLGLAVAHRHEGLALPGAESLLALQPLDADAVRSVAVGYAPGHDAVDVPVEELVETSGGVPRRVHEVASAWARRAAARRVMAFAPRASAGRAELRWAEAELAESVVDFQAARERRWCARSRAWPRLRSPTPGTSSDASGSLPSSSRGP